MHERLIIHKAYALQDVMRVVSTQMGANTSTHRIPKLHVP